LGGPADRSRATSRIAAGLLQHLYPKGGDAGVAVHRKYRIAQVACELSAASVKRSSKGGQQRRRSLLPIACA